MAYDRILFHFTLHCGRYLEVVRCCGLRYDISILPSGDETEIGEEGINLSKEQKQRISIGRALYSKANTVFLVSIINETSITLLILLV